MWVELASADAERLGIREGDLVRVESPRGAIEAKARVTGMRAGVVFAPFHFGYWDEADGARPDGRARAANELTISDWDPVSKQPLFKVAVVRLEKIASANGRPAPAPTTTASEPLGDGIAPTSGGERVRETLEARQ
jgi:anaerobic selenocysteine-containing dehydrogenase